VYELFIDLGANAAQLDFPVLYTNAKLGTATPDLSAPGTDLRPLFDALVATTPPPTYLPGYPLQLLVTNLTANDYVGRMAVGRVWNGTLRMGQRIAVVREEADAPDGSVEPGRTTTLTGTVTSLTTAKGIDRVDLAEAGPGDIIAVAGIPDVTIGDTITDPADPRPLPRLEIDEPTLSMTFGVNTSPLAGRDGKYVTSRQIKERLDREVLGNVSIEVLPTATPDTFEVRGRGELQLAVLIEQMRREGFELQVSRPEVLLREVDGETHEPYERITVDIPPEFIGPVSQSLAERKARMELMTTDADGRTRMEFLIPTRGLVGYRGQLLTETRGTALLHQIGAGYGPWAGEVTHRTSGVLVSDRAGESNAYGLFNLQERARMLIGSGEQVYEGMIVGENSRPNDMDVNPTKEKKLTNIRTHSHDEMLRLTPPPPLTLESAIEFVAADELVEVTPHSLRLRKRLLSQHDRRREAGRVYDERRRDEQAAEG
jgi:GTP-binding protein